MSTSTAGRYQVGATGRWSGNLTRENGAYIPLINITGASVWLRDGSSGAAIRGTSAAAPQSIWLNGVGTNNFQFAEGTDSDGNAITTIGWDVQKTDVALHNASLSREEHVAEILVNYNEGSAQKTLRFTHRLRCVDTPGLCLYEDVADAIEGLDEARSRMLIEDAIEAAGAIAEYRTKRRFRYAANVTTVKSITDGQRVVQLDRYPIVSVASVKEDVDGVFDLDSMVLEAADYWLPDGGAKGQIEHRWRSFIAGAGCWQSVHTGGLFMDTAGVPPDLRMAAREQVVFWYKRRDQAGLQSISVPGSSVTIFSTAPTLKLFDAVVSQYKMPRHW